MAWRSSGSTNAELIENLANNGLIRDDRVKEAFLKVDRAHYAPSSPYKDSPQAIGHGATISAPHMHACAVEYLINYLTPDKPRRVLDIGSGSGYLTQILAEVIGEKGRVVGVEHIKALKELGEKNMKKSQRGRELLEDERLEFVVGDGRKGWNDGKGGWDAIHVGASAKEVHKELIDQLKSPGCLFIPVDDDESGYGQHVWKIAKDEAGKVHRERLFGVRYVPLTDAPK